MNRAGSYLYEPVDSVHTLFVPSDNTEETEMWSVVYGNTEYLDDNDDVTYVSNWKAMLHALLRGMRDRRIAPPQRHLALGHSARSLTGQCCNSSVAIATFARSSSHN